MPMPQSYTMITMLWVCKSAFILLMALFIRHHCYGQRVPTKVTYESVTPHTDITGASVQRANGYYQVLHIDEIPDPDVLVVGEKNFVRIYSTTNVSDVQPGESNLPMKEPEGGALPCAAVSGDQAALQCENYINVIKEYNDNWYYCGTSGINPQCWICNSLTCTGDEIASSFVAAGFVTRDREVNQPLLFLSGKVYGAAAQNANTNSGHAMRRGEVKANGQFDQTDTQTIKTDDDNSDWINEPEFIGDPIQYTDVDGDTHIYIFYRESATEYINADKAVFSRVARVCNDDDGGDPGTLLDGIFTTFLKARLNCSTPGDFPFNYDYLQDIYQSPTNKDVIYAAFTDNPVSDRANSAICVYRMDEIAAVFKNSKFKGQASPSTLWLPPSDADVPDPRPGTCPTRTDTADYPFIANYVLMDQSVPNKQDYRGSAGAFDRDSDAPLMILDGLYITELVVDEGVSTTSGQTYDVFFLGTKNGKMYKAYVHGIATPDAQARLVEEIDLGVSDSSDDEGVLSMIIHSGTVFIGTVSSLHGIPAQHCVDMAPIKCVTAQDPYCALNDTAQNPYSSCEAAISDDQDQEQCLDNVYSCGEWPGPECFDPMTFETTDCTKPTPLCQECCNTDTCQLPDCHPKDCQPDYRVTGAAADTGSTVQINTWVRAEENSVWGVTNFDCSCGCPPYEVQETIGLRNDSMEYLLGVYFFDMSSCTNLVDITFTFEANGNQLEKVISVEVDTEPLITDEDTLEKVNGKDEKISAYYYQVRWWKKNRKILPLRKAERANCYNCERSP